MRMFSRSSLFGSAIVYAGSNVLNAIVPFLLLPILTRVLPPEEYGQVAMFQVLTGIVGPFVGLSVHGAIARMYYERESIDLPAYVFGCFLILTVSSTAVAVLLLPLGGYVEGLTAFPSSLLWVVIVYSLGQFLSLIALTMYQVRVRPLSYAAFSISKTVLDGLLSLIFVLALHWGWEGRVAGQTTAVVMAGALSIMLLVRAGWLSHRVNLAYIRHALSFGVPLVPHALGMWGIQMTDRVLLVNMVGLEETGIYFVGLQIGLAIRLLQDSFNNAWTPYFFHTLKRDDIGGRRRLVRITYIYSLFLIAAALLLGWLAPRVLGFIAGESYASAAPYVGWIAVGYAFNGIYKMFANYAFFVQKTHYLAWITFSTAAVNVVASWYLIRLNGTVGAAQGSLLAFLVSLVGTWILATRIYRMPWFRIPDGE